MIGRSIGQAVAAGRDGLARGLIRLHVTPNALSLTGMVLTAAAGVCYAIGAARGFAWSLDPRAEAGAYLLLAGGLAVLASACDMLDGAVARLGGQNTPFGAFLDSTLDRFSDFAIYAGIAVAYAARAPANLTFVLLSMIAFFAAFLISYSRARAEDLIDACKVGFWQRGERSAAILTGTFAHNIPALVVQQALLPAFTALRRIFYTRAVLAGRQPVTDPRRAGWAHKLRLWRWPRGTWGYDLAAAANIAWLLLARIPARDVLRMWFG